MLAAFRFVYEKSLYRSQATRVRWDHWTACGTLSLGFTFGYNSKERWHCTPVCRLRTRNCAIKRERYPTPTVDDLLHETNGAEVFSKLDLRSGYHQLTLAEERRYITTFVTHKGLHQYTRLNFETNSASDIFQKVIHDQIHDIPGAINIRDDVII